MARNQANMQAMNWQYLIMILIDIRMFLKTYYVLGRQLKYDFDLEEPDRELSHFNASHTDFFYDGFL